MRAQRERRRTRGRRRHWDSGPETRENTQPPCLSQPAGCVAVPHSRPSAAATTTAHRRCCRLRCRTLSVPAPHFSWSLCSQLVGCVGACEVPRSMDRSAVAIGDAQWSVTPTRSWVGTAVRGSQGTLGSAARAPPALCRRRRRRHRLISLQACEASKPAHRTLCLLSAEVHARRCSSASASAAALRRAPPIGRGCCVTVGLDAADAARHPLASPRHTTRHKNNVTCAALS